MTNFFSDNPDLLFHFSNMDLRKIVGLIENEYRTNSEDATEQAGPANYEDAIDIYRQSLELLGDISAKFIAPRSASIDVEGSHLRDGKVVYARGTEESRAKLAESGFMGVMLPREYGGSSFPATVYMMMIEILSRADASMMTLFGYQDVGELIARFGSDEQATEFLPGLASESLEFSRHAPYPLPRWPGGVLPKPERDLGFLPRPCTTPPTGVRVRGTLVKTSPRSQQIHP